MQDICAEVGAICGKQPQTVYQAIARAVKDIWEYGNIPNLEQVVGYTLCVKPSPKELVISLAESFWNQEDHETVEYSVLESGIPRRYGIWGRNISGGECCVIIAPFSSQREAARRMAERLNVEQVTAAMLKEWILQGEIPDFLKTDPDDCVRGESAEE